MTNGEFLSLLEQIIRHESVQRATLAQQEVELEAWREVAQSVGAVHPTQLHRHLARVPSSEPRRSSLAGSRDWTPYRLKGVVEMRLYVPGEDLSEIHVGDPSRMDGGMVCRDPDHPDQKHWYLDHDYIARHYEPVADEATKEGT